MTKKQFIIGLCLSIISLILGFIQSGIKTCADSGIGCQSWEELFYALVPIVFSFVLFVAGIMIMYDSLQIGGNK